MKMFLLSFAVLGSLALLSSEVTANDKIKLEDLKPRFDTPDGPDYTKPAPKIETDYQRFEKRVKELRKADGFGVGYENKTPVIKYKHSFD